MSLCIKLNLNFQTYNFLLFQCNSVVLGGIFRIVADILDFSVQARHYTKTSQNKSLHWTHAFAVKNRVNPDYSLSYDKINVGLRSQLWKWPISSHPKMTRKRFIMIWFHLYTEKFLNTCHVMYLLILVSSTTYHTSIRFVTLEIK